MIFSGVPDATDKAAGNRNHNHSASGKRFPEWKARLTMAEDRKEAAEEETRAAGRKTASAGKRAAEKDDSLEMVNLSDLTAYQADITFRDGSQLTVPLIYESEEEAEKERASYTQYMRSMMAHSEPFPLYFGSMIIRGEDIRVFNFHESEPREEHEKIGFTSK